MVKTKELINCPKVLLLIPLKKVQNLVLTSCIRYAICQSLSEGSVSLVPYPVGQ